MRLASPGHPGNSQARDLTIGTDRYVFAEHALDGTAAYRAHPWDHRTVLVVSGTVELAHARGRQRYGPGEGWHAPAGAVYRMTDAGTEPAEPAIVIEAGSAKGHTIEADPGRAASFDYLDLSRYTVDKPWGYEVWYTANLTNPDYALKRIHMTAGHQSSLQSHRYKAETNYVIEGEATVLSGLTAPDDLTRPIELDLLTTTVHQAGSGWTSPPGELHRVIARQDYTAIEISTPELDDVIRWQDDTGRGHGRIDSEHAGGGQ
jgi:quercetin dioxygenase-like cupin family protein